MCSIARNPWANYTYVRSDVIYTRSILAASGSLYYCDENPNKQNRMECYMSTDSNPHVWTTVNEV